MNPNISCTYIGHATALIDVGGSRLLTDPNFGKRVLCSPRRSELAFDPANLPELSCVLLSHHHCDHLDVPSFKFISCGVPVIVPEGSEPAVSAFLSNPIIELSHYANHELPCGLEITAVPVIHSKSHIFPGMQSRANAYLVRKQGVRGTVFFCGDSAYGPQFREIGNLGEIDIALLPIGGYEPRCFMGRMHMTPAEAVTSFEDLRARHMIPIHHGTFRLSMENIDAPMAWLTKILAERPDLGNRIHPLQSGEQFRFEPQGADAASSV
jgi:L-ascorbate metabolism protein UlaG (beta-lactamase superfamily)